MNLSYLRLPFCGRSPWRAIAASLFLSAAIRYTPPTASAAPTAPASAASAADAAPASAILQVGGAVRSPLTLQRADFAAMPRTTITVKDKTGANITYEGVELSELLKRAGAPLGEALRGPALLLVVVVTASDGYHALFTLSELDPAVTDKKALLADMAGGKPLPPQTGPLRLVIPDDKRHPRWVHQVTRIDILRVNPAPASPAAPSNP